MNLFFYSNIWKPDVCWKRQTYSKIFCSECSETGHNEDFKNPEDRKIAYSGGLEGFAEKEIKSWKVWGTSTRRYREELYKLRGEYVQMKPYSAWRREKHRKWGKLESDNQLKTASRVYILPFISAYYYNLLFVWSLKLLWGFSKISLWNFILIFSFKKCK